MSRDYTFIATDRPVNAAAANMLRHGESYESPVKICCRHWTACPWYYDWPGKKSMDLTGRRFGRFTVIGMYDRKSWLVRCDCGRYETRRRRAILNPKNQDDCCTVCRDLEYMKRQERRKLSPDL